MFGVPKPTRQCGQEIVGDLPERGAAPRARGVSMGLRPSARSSGAAYAFSRALASETPRQATEAHLLKRATPAEPSGRESAGDPRRRQRNRASPTYSCPDSAHSPLHSRAIDLVALVNARKSPGSKPARRDRG